MEATERIESVGESAALTAARQLAAAVTGRRVDEIHADDRLLDDLLLDSLEIIEMSMMIEETWGIVLDEAGLKQLATVKDVARLLPADARLPIP